jgi:cadmium resistance protein CadD (predicted permease)
VPEAALQVLSAAGVFAGTNVDDLLVLTVLFLSARATGRPTQRQVWAGQYAGIGLLTAASLAAAVGLTVVPDEAVGLLGLVPLGLGLRGLWLAARGDADDDPPPVAAGFWSVAGLTVANGADNVAVYTPVFRAQGTGAVALTVSTFAVLVAVWCTAARALGGHGLVVAVVRRWGRWIVPLAFVAIGATILLGSDVLGGA